MCSGFSFCAEDFEGTTKTGNAKAFMSSPFKRTTEFFGAPQPGRQTAGPATLTGKPRERGWNCSTVSGQIQNQKSNHPKTRTARHLYGCLAVCSIQTS